MKSIISLPNAFMFARKSRNIYKYTSAGYDKIIKENITKTHKLSLKLVRIYEKQVSSVLSVTD